MSREQGSVPGGFCWASPPGLSRRLDLELKNHGIMKTVGFSHVRVRQASAQPASWPSAPRHKHQAPTTDYILDPGPSEAAAVNLPYGVDDVLKLSRAQASEDVTLNYIRSTGTIYNLAPNDIVYLRNEGVSDRVINTMLDQRKNVPAETATQPAPAPRQSIQTPTRMDRARTRNMRRPMFNRRQFTPSRSPLMRQPPPFI